MKAVTARALINWPWRTASFRLTAVVTALFLCAGLALMGGVYWSVSDLLLRQTVRDVTQRTSRLHAALEGARRSQVRETITRLAASSDGALYVLAGDEVLLGASGHDAILAGNLQRWPKGLSAHGRADVFEFNENGRRVLAVAIVRKLADGRVLLVGERASAQQALTERLRWIVVAGGLLVVLLGMAIGLALGYFVMRRIDEISRAGDAFLKGDLDVRVPVSGADDELDELARHLNDLLARIGQLMKGMREVSDNIAHDLKTPLSRLRIRAEAALDDRLDDDARRDALGEILVETDDIIRTFNALLQVARLEAGTLDKSPEVFDLAALVRDVAELYEPVAEEAGARLVVAAPASLRVSAHRQLVGQAITNLLENGLKYGCGSGHSPQLLDVRLVVEEGEIVLAIADRGPGIAAGDRERALQRFVRLDKSRTKPGTGLGLSLVAAVAHGHGGRVVLLDNAPGLIAQFRLPGSLLADESGGRAERNATRDKELA